MYRLASNADFPAIAALWGQAFGDSPQVVRDFFAAFPNCRSYVAEEQGKVVSMVHALPEVLALSAQERIPAAYLYAVATDADFQGRGLCRRLMAFAEEDLQNRGFAATILTPASPGLFDFYGKLGYAPGFTRKHHAWNGLGQEISPKEYLSLREALLPLPHMVYDLATLEYAAHGYGLSFYRTPTGCAAAGQDFTAEVLPEDLGGSAFAMVKGLGQKISVNGGFLGFPLE